MLSDPAADCCGLAASQEVFHAPCVKLLWPLIFGRPHRQLHR